MRIYLTLIVIFFAINLTIAQNNVGIGTTSPNPKAILDLRVANPTTQPQGLLLPRLSQTQRSAMSLTASDSGMVIFNESSQVIEFWDGTEWKAAVSDNLGNHTLTQHLQTTGNYWINADGDTLEGIGVDTAGNVRIVSNNEGDFSQGLSVLGGKLNVSYRQSQYTAADLEPLSGPLGSNGIATAFSGDLYLRAYWSVNIDRRGGNTGDPFYGNGANPDGGSFSVRVRTDANTFRTDLIVRGNGDVGIGHTAPDARLHVQDANNRLAVFKGAGTSDQSAFVEINNPAGTRALFGAEGDGLGGGDVQDVVLGNWSNGDLQFFTNATQQMTLDNQGRLGIGSNIPQQTLDVNGRINVSQGVIHKGCAPITATGDLGLYSQVGSNWIRIVTTDAPIRFFDDGGTGSNPIFTIDNLTNSTVVEGQYRYENNQLRWYSIPVKTFVMQGEVNEYFQTNWEIDRLYIKSTNPGFCCPQFVAPLNLPHGATITDVKMVVDAVSDGITAHTLTVFRTSPLGGTETIGYVYGDPDDDGLITYSGFDFLDTGKNIVNNEGYSYLVEITFNDATVSPASNYAYRNVWVQYSVNQAD